jgi:hypothetical protein
LQTTCGLSARGGDESDGSAKSGNKHKAIAVEIKKIHALGTSRRADEFVRWNATGKTLAYL